MCFVHRIPFFLVVDFHRTRSPVLAVRPRESCQLPWSQKYEMDVRLSFVSTFCAFLFLSYQFQFFSLESFYVPRAHADFVVFDDVGNRKGPVRVCLERSTHDVYAVHQCTQVDDILAARVPGDS